MVFNGSVMVVNWKQMVLNRNGIVVNENAKEDDGFLDCYEQNEHDFYEQRKY